MPLTPNNREEHWLQGMVDGETTLTPNNRREHWYEEIINASGGGGGTGGGVLVVNDNNGTIDKTWNEINNAAFATIKKTDSFGATFSFIAGIFTGSEVFPYSIMTFDNDGDAFHVRYYETNSADGYPVLQD